MGERGLFIVPIKQKTPIPGMGGGVKFGGGKRDALRVGQVLRKGASGRWRGLDFVQTNLRLQIIKIPGRTLGGLLAGALVVKRDAIKLAPVDTGNMRNSAYVIWGKGGKGKVRRGAREGKFKDKKRAKSSELGGTAAQMAAHDAAIIANRSIRTVDNEPFAEIGFTANYALNVHENLTTYHKTGQAKFLEQALMKNKREIVRQIKIRAKVIK